MLRTFLPLVALTLAAQTPAPKPAEAPKAIEAPKAEATKPVPVTPKVEAAPAPQPAPAAAAPPKAVPAPKAAPAAPKAAAGVTLGAEAPEKKAEDKVIAKVGTSLIRESDLDAALSGMNPTERQQLSLVQGAKDQYITRLVEMHLLAAKAKKLGLDSTEAYKRSVGLVMTQLLAQEYLKKEGESLNKRMVVTDEDTKAYYETHKAQFMTPGKFSARHLLVSVKSERTQNQGYTDQEARERLAKVQTQLQAGKKLEDLCKEWSDDPGSKEKGGLYENIAFGQFVPEFEVAVKAQEVGKVGDPVKTPFGYHLIQVEKVMPGDQMGFEQAKEQAKQKATEARREQVWGGFIGDIKKEIPFEMNPDPKKLGTAKSAPKAAKPAAKPAAKKA
jgi:peptidyl-prolyl cis-trans isomerase C